MLFLAFDTSLLRWIHSWPRSDIIAAATLLIAGLALLITLTLVKSTVGRVIVALLASVIIVVGLSLKDLVLDRIAADISPTPTPEQAAPTPPPKPTATAPPRPKPTATPTPSPTATPFAKPTLPPPEVPEKRDAYWIKVGNNTKAEVTFIVQNEDDTWSIVDLEPRETALYSWKPGQERALHLEKNDLGLDFAEKTWQAPNAAFFSRKDVFDEREVPEYYFELTEEGTICVCQAIEALEATPTPKAKSQRTSPTQDAEYCAMLQNETGINLDIDLDENGVWKHQTVIPNHVGYCLGGKSKRLRFRHRKEWNGGWREFIGSVDGWPCTEWPLPSVTLRRNRSGKIFIEKR